MSTAWVLNANEHGPGGRVGPGRVAVGGMVVRAVRIMACDYRAFLRTGPIGTAGHSYG